MREWSISETATEQELSVLSEGVLQVGRALAVNGNARPLACLVREGGSIIAGGSGRTEFERLFVQYLWVAERYRGRGLGSEVLSRLEAAARQRGSRDALIETLSDRVAELYRRLGYAPVATIPRYVGEFTRHIMVKALGD
jgi:ribosomal protein S18 acetylase RimI-like enzyme